MEFGARQLELTQAGIYLCDVAGPVQLGKDMGSGTPRGSRVGVLTGRGRGMGIKTRIPLRGMQCLGQTGMLVIELGPHRIRPCTISILL